MRKQKLIIFIFFVVSIQAFSQYRIEKTLTDTCYVLEKLDTLNFPENLPNGKWKYLYPEKNENMVAEFSIINNKINGEFKYWIRGGLIATGYYSNDSLWTFYNPEGFHYDTTFMIGVWFFHNPLGWTNRKFKIPFNETNTFTQIMTDEKGSLHTKYIWDKTLGLIEETWYDNSQKTSEFIKTKHYSIKTEWTEDAKIQSVEIIQDSLLYENNLKRSERFYNNVGISIISLEKYPDTDIRIPVVEIKNDGKDIIDVNVNDSSFNFKFLKKNGKKKYKQVK